MVTKAYQWAAGALLEDHTKRKLKILREYFFRYISVRCQIPQQEKFRLVVVDGFSGGGRYSCGTGGSPIIFIEELRNALDAVNTQRAAQNLNAVEIECLLVFNDADLEAATLLKENCEPLIGEIRATHSKLHIQVRYLSSTFETSYPQIKQLISSGRYRSVLYNLDQYGHSQVDIATLLDIMQSTTSVEIFYTFAIESLLAFLSKTNPQLMAAQLQHLGIDGADLRAIEGKMSNSDWLGAAEKLVFESFKRCAPFVSPFSINNPNGWRYWLIHFANNYRARQVYNDILHDNSSDQAHFGRSGLDMLAYDPNHQAGSLYLFDLSGRTAAKNQLMDDIPRLLTESGDAISIIEFYETIYNATPAHKDDVHSAIIENTDLEVRTPSGGTRRSANAIDVSDTLKLKEQRSFFPIFFSPAKPRNDR